MSEILDAPGAGAAALRGGALRVVGYMVGVLLSTVSAALLFRHLPVGDAGHYVFAVSIVTIAAGLTDVGLSALGVRETTQSDLSERRTILRNLLGLRVVLSCIGAVVACLYAVTTGHSSEVVVGTLLVSVAFLVQGVVNVTTIALQADLRFGALTVIDLVRQVAGVTIIVALVLTGSGLLAFYGALVLAAMAGLAVALGVLGDGLLLRPRFDWARWRELMKRTLPYSLATAVGVLYFRVGVLAVDLLASDEQTGLYAISFRAVDVLSVVPALAIGAAFPVFSRAAAKGDAERLRHGVQRSVELALALGAFFGVALFAAAPTIVELIGGSKYASASTVLRWHALAIAGTCAASPYGYVLLALSRVRQVLVVVLIACAVSIAVSAPLTLWYGANGAAGAAAVAEWTLAIGGAIAIRRTASVRVTYGALVRVGAVACVALVPSALLAPTPAAVTGCVLALAGFWALGVIPPELRSLRSRTRTD